MPIEIDDLLRTEVPRAMQSNGFQVSEGPDCKKLISTVTVHLRALLVDVQIEVNRRLAIERLNKITARQKSYELWIAGICFNFAKFYKENLRMGDVSLGHLVPCDFSTLQIDYLNMASLRTVEYVNRRERHRPHGGRRRSSHVSLPLRVYTVPSAR